MLATLPPISAASSGLARTCAVSPARACSMSCRQVSAARCCPVRVSSQARMTPSTGRRARSPGGSRPSQRAVSARSPRPSRCGLECSIRSAASSWFHVAYRGCGRSEHPVLDQIGRQLVVSALQGVVDRRVQHRRAMGGDRGGVPGRRPTVQHGDRGVHRRGEPGTQHVGEQSVVAVPAPLRIERNQEEVGALEPLKRPLRRRSSELQTDRPTSRSLLLLHCCRLRVRRHTGRRRAGRGWRSAAGTAGSRGAGPGAPPR